MCDSYHDSYVYTRRTVSEVEVSDDFLYLLLTRLGFNRVYRNGTLMFTFSTIVIY